MAKHTVLQASKLVGKSRNIIYTAIKSGKLSAEQNREGNTVIDTAELLRVFGAFEETVQDSNKADSSDVLQNTKTAQQKQEKQQPQPHDFTSALLLELGELRAAKLYLEQIANDAKERSAADNARANAAEVRLQEALASTQKLLQDLEKVTRRRK